MWRLIESQLRYFRVTIIAAYGLALVLATVLVVVPPENGTEREAEPMPVLGLALFVAYTVVVGTMVSADRRERRLRLHLVLPASVTAVGLGRLLTSLGVAFLGLVLGAVAFLGVRLIGLPGVSFKALLVANTLIVLAGQGIFLVEEVLVRSSRGGFWWLVVVLWLALVFGLAIFPPPEEGSLADAWDRLLANPLRMLGLYLAVPAIVALNLRLFVRRPHWLT